MQSSKLLVKVLRTPSLLACHDDTSDEYEAYVDNRGEIFTAPWKFVFGLYLYTDLVEGEEIMRIGRKGKVAGRRHCTKCKNSPDSRVARGVHEGKCVDALIRRILASIPMSVGRAF